MTRVDFYILAADNEEARLRAACRIVEKAYRQRQHVVVRTSNAVAAKHVDDLLWIYAQNSFVPHRIVGPDFGSSTPPERVLIAYEDLSEALAHEVMVNLAEEVPDSFSRYLRIVEIVDAEPTRRDRGRARYRYYRDRGYELKTHDI